MKLHEITAALQLELPPGPDPDISGVCDPEAPAPGTVAFIRSDKISEKVYQTAAALIVDTRLMEKLPLPASVPVIQTGTPALTFIALLELFNPYKDPTVENFADSLPHPQVKAGNGLKLGANCVIQGGTTLGDHVTLMGNNFIGENVTIGSNVLLYPGVVILSGCEIGSQVIIHGNTVIGGDGFGYEKTDTGLVKIPQIGRVILGDRVEIGCNVAIDRATIGVTRIGNDVKIDNTVQIGHNVTVGDFSILCGQVGIAGSSKLGSGVVLAGQAGIADHADVADNVTVGAQSGVMTNQIVKKGSVIFGSPAIPIRDALKLIAYYRRLPELFKKGK